MKARLLFAIIGAVMLIVSWIIDLSTVHTTESSDEEAAQTTRQSPAMGKALK